MALVCWNIAWTFLTNIELRNGAISNDCLIRAKSRTTHFSLSFLLSRQNKQQQKKPGNHYTFLHNNQSTAVVPIWLSLSLAYSLLTPRRPRIPLQEHKFIRLFNREGYDCYSILLLFAFPPSSFRPIFGYRRLCANRGATSRLSMEPKSFFLYRRGSHNTQVCGPAFERSFCSSKVKQA